MTSRSAATLGVLLIALAACGGSDVSPATDSVSSTTATTGTDAPAPATTPEELADLVLSSELAEQGMTPVPGESGEVTADVLPPDSALRAMLEGFGVLDGYATVFATDDGGETIIVAAIRFETEAGASDAFATFEGVQDDISSAAGPVIFAATGDPLLGSCASIDLLEQTGDVLTVWLNTSDCHTWDEESPAGELDCPAEMAVGEIAEVIVTVPSHYEPLAWQTDADNLFWLEGYQLELGEQTVEGDEVRLSVGIIDNNSVVDTDADLKAVLFTYSDIPAFGGTYRVSGPRVEAECTIRIVAASP